MILMVIFILEILLENTEDFSVTSVVPYILRLFIKFLTLPFIIRAGRKDIPTLLASKFLRDN
jgi:hypothetical protein